MEYKVKRFRCVDSLDLEIQLKSFLSDENITTIEHFTITNEIKTGINYLIGVLIYN